MSLRISVVVSTYNGESCIIEQLESLRNQTRKADEVIICDDCSKDNTFDSVKEYLKKSQLDNWRLIKNEKNKGWKRNFIELIESSTGDLIFPCDQDDYWFSNKLEIMENIMESNPNVNVLVSYLKERYPNGKELFYPKRGDGRLVPIHIKKRFMNVEYPGCVYCLRACFARECNKYWKPTIPHDGLYWRLSMFDSSLYELRIPLISQRKYSNSTFAQEAKMSRNIQSKIDEISYTDDMLSSISSFIEDRGIDNNRSVAILNNARRWNADRLNFFKKKELIDGIKLLRYIPYYQTTKRYLLDIYLVVFKKGRGADYDHEEL